ncbi:hypothetical protein L9F63_007283 [Diploptera punctata]|uniref:Uncharacterized protein n=1 Tax=Diploptera punctata TaxID=6984 RepID=A0AAD7Z7Y2_DIPPU|nr:hypothetical protein L9F63_007283 [Diploptera punctata]
MWLCQKHLDFSSLMTNFRTNVSMNVLESFFRRCQNLSGLCIYPSTTTEDTFKIVELFRAEFLKPTLLMERASPPLYDVERVNETNSNLKSWACPTHFFLSESKSAVFPSFPLFCSTVEMAEFDEMALFDVGAQEYIEEDLCDQANCRHHRHRLYFQDIPVYLRDNENPMEK